mmetsp:Transcript_39224/g.77162  ORF Transcript_39224/g.77162 Transcript_39224/m.77162 type:complete len:84 (+) Transcript_39224:79-330(+)
MDTQNPQECGPTEYTELQTHRTRRSVDTQNLQECGHTELAGVRTHKSVEGWKKELATALFVFCVSLLQLYVHLSYPGMSRAFP